MSKIEIDRNSGTCFGVARAINRAEEELKKVEQDKKNGTATSQQVAVARAKVTTAKNNVAQAKAKADLNPDKRSIKQWQDLYKTLNEVNKTFEEIGDTIGGVAGDIIKTAGQISTSALTMINGIMQLTQNASTGVQGTATAASKAPGVVFLRYSSAVSDCATIAAKACGSWIAMSDRTLRSTSMPALFRPSMKRP